MKNQKINISENLVNLRKINKLSIEDVADKIGVSRQAISRWESGESVPDIINCDALAEFYNVSLDDLLHYSQKESGLPIAPKGKHIFGTTVIGERGQVVIPKPARETMNLKAGDVLLVLGDENQGTKGIAFVPADNFMNQVKEIMDSFHYKTK
ncbi:helix-turn-helix domain-containing protein [Candidatus Pseudoruminococcus sp.]|uniref:helix-turn-helix domain-containing protein n=1 Tax=Candidatus Pseudoruminococcus sp. TaxID=3101048 RepID=UPI003999CD98